MVTVNSRTSGFCLSNVAPRAAAENGIFNPTPAHDRASRAIVAPSTIIENCCAPAFLAARHCEV